MEISTDRDGSQEVSFEYMYNEDGFSRNDKSHILVGNILISPTGVIIKNYLKETHRGAAAQKRFKSKN